MAWIGVDLDGTLAQWPSGEGIGVIGPPIEVMVERVRQWISDGREVRIVTARVAATGDYVPESKMYDDEKFAREQRELIHRWCETHIGRALPVTASKDYAMLELWDDRAIQVVTNTGVSV